MREYRGFAVVLFEAAAIAILLYISVSMLMGVGLIKLLKAKYPPYTPLVLLTMVFILVFDFFARAAGSTLLSIFYRGVKYRISSYSMAPYKLGPLKVHCPGRIIEGILYVPLLVDGILLYRYNVYVGSAFIITSLLGLVYNFDKGLFTPLPISVRRISSKWYISLVVSRSWLRSLAEEYMKLVGLRDKIRKAGVYESPIRLSYKTISLFILSIPLSIALIIPLALTLNPLVALTPIAIPFFVLLYTPLNLKIIIRERKRRCEEELPYFTLLASILQAAGEPLPRVFERITRMDLFNALRGEAHLIRRNMSVLGMDPISAMEFNARNHPSVKFHDFILGYTSIFRSGGDLVKYLEERVKEYLHDLTLSFKLYAEKAVDMGEIIISVFLLGSIMILSAALVLPYGSLQLIRQFNYMIIPCLACSSYIMVHYMQPKLRDDYSINLGLPVLASGITGLVLYLMDFEFWIILSGILIALALVYGLLYSKQKVEVDLSEKALPDFLRDIIEYRKMGYTISQALEKISYERKYNRVFDDIVASALAHIRTLGEIRVKCRSWLVRLVFTLLGEIEKSGGGTPQLLEMLLQYVRDVISAKRDSKKILFRYEVIAYSAPIILAFTTSLIVQLILLYSSIMGEAVKAGFTFFGAFNVPPELLSERRVTIVISSFILALLTSKIVDLTVRNTLRALVIIVLSVLAIIVSEPLARAFITSLSSPGW